MNLRFHTTKEAAHALGRTVRTVQRDCVRLGLGRVIGTLRLLSDAEVETLRSADRPRPGNPKMSDPKAARRLQRKSVKSRRARTRTAD